MVTIEVPDGMTVEEVLAARRKARLLNGTPAPARRAQVYVPAGDPLLAPAAVAAIWRVDVTTVTRWEKAGVLPCIRTPGRQRRFRRSDVIAGFGGEPVPLLTPKEVAEMFGVGPAAVWRWVKAGWLTDLKTPGGSRRYLESEVRAHRAGETQGRAETQPERRAA